MGSTDKLLVGLVLAVVAVLTSGQQRNITFPKRPVNFPPFPGGPPAGAGNNPSRNPILRGPPPVSSFLRTYCSLTFTAPFKDPSILETTPAQVSAAMARAEVRLDAQQRLYLDGVRMQNKARDERRNRDQGRPIGGPGRASAPGRSKRQTDAIAVLAPTEKTSVCRSVEKVVQSVFVENEVCYLFPEDEVNYWECGTSFAGFPNTDIKLQRYYCEADNYVYQSVMSYCPDSDSIKWATIYVPISCCARRYSCDFTPYSSVDGPKQF